MPVFFQHGLSSLIALRKRHQISAQGQWALPSDAYRSRGSVAASMGAWSAKLFTACALGVAYACVSLLPSLVQAQESNAANQPPSISFPSRLQQGSMVIGRVPPNSIVTYRGRTLRTTPYGTVVFGLGRNEQGPAVVQVQKPDGSVERVSIEVTGRDWPTEYVNGVPPKTARPQGAIAERIQREQAEVTRARERNDNRTDFAQAFIWPVKGRISGRFGNARVYNGLPSGSGHSGMDIAAPTGTPVKAPAAGIVTFAKPDMYLTGGTLLIDHGFGISSNFLHLSRIDVKVGDRVEQGQVIAAVGATGRATGPHLHWGMNWFDVRIDPLLVLERTQAN